MVQRVDRAVALPGHDIAHALGLELDRRLGDRFAGRRGLGDHPPRLDVDIGRSRSLDSLHQEQLERGVGRLERVRSEEQTSELQSLMRISYAVFCLKNNKT